MNIPSLINMGYAAADILGVISKKNVAAGRKISRALSLGYAANTILHKLIGGKGDDEDYLTLEQKTDANVKKQRRNALAGTGLAAAGVLGGIGALASGLGRGAATAAAGPATEAATASPATAVTEAALGAVPKATPTITQGQQSILNKVPSLAEAPQSPESISPTTESIAPPTQAQEGLDYYKTKTAQTFPQLTQFVEKHRDAGKSSEETHKILQSSKLLRGPIEQFEKETGQSFRNAVDQIYMQDVPKGDLVMTPLGAGKVHKTHKGEAFVEVGDGLRKFPESELQKPPEDVVEAVNNILKIPEIDRSSNVALFLYDPSESKAVFQFHDGSAYKYLDIDPEVVRKIAEKEATPITQGKNTYGAWSPEDKHGSLGAALWAYVLKDPKYKKSLKGENANPNYMKLETLYDYWKGLRKRKK